MGSDWSANIYEPNRTDYLITDILGEWPLLCVVNVCTCVERDFVSQNAATFTLQADVNGRYAMIQRRKAMVTTSHLEKRLICSLGFRMPPDPAVFTLEGVFNWNTVRILNMGKYQDLYIQVLKLLGDFFFHQINFNLSYSNLQAILKIYFRERRL